MIQNPSPNYLQLSQDFLMAVKTSKEIIIFLKELAIADESVLQNQLFDDNKRLAFWINIYNATCHFALQQNPARYHDRSTFFKSDLIEIASQKLSLDDIEHGILRRSKLKLSYGYLENPFPNDFEKKFRVDKLDYRIHFALNCGARSCPPIAFYDENKINEQLRLAMEGHLKAEAVCDKSKNEILLPAFMGWFRADFGGKDGMIDVLKQLSILPRYEYTVIGFKEYDWQVYLDNFMSNI